MKKSWSTLSGAAVVASLVFSSAQANRAPEAVPGEILVGLREGFAASSVSQTAIRTRLVQFLGRDSVREVTSLQMDSSIQKIVLRDPSQTRAAISTLKESFAAGVKYAEPNFIYRVNAGEPNDPDFADKQWDMKNTGQIDKPETGKTGTVGSDINVVPLWNEGVTGTRSLLVAVIDSGVDYTHADLVANIYRNPGEIAGNGLDDDANGVIDDVHGVDFSAANGVAIGNGMDDHNHGTHCAGSIGAVGNDSNGISGVNWATSILPVKFLNAKGSGTSAGAINSVKYATKMGAKVLSNSWGGGPFSFGLKAAIEESNAAGTIFVAAAGNDGLDNDSDPHYPSSYEVANVVSVGASDNRDAIASFSNYGWQTVHVTAPGRYIYSTIRNGAYATYSGTSMATPHVAGIAALIWGANPTWTAAEVKKRLIETSKPVPGLRRKSVSAGRVDAYNAFHGIVTPSGDPAESEWRSVAVAAESAHPYADNSDLKWEISMLGAKYLRVVFEKVETEARYDALTLESATGEVIEKISGAKTGEYVTDFIPADRLILRLKSDSIETAFGFKISKIQYIE